MAQHACTIGTATGGQPKAELVPQPLAAASFQLIDTNKCKKMANFRKRRSNLINILFEEFLQLSVPTVA